MLIIQNLFFFKIVFTWCLSLLLMIHNLFNLLLGDYFFFNFLCGCLKLNDIFLFFAAFRTLGNIINLLCIFSGVHLACDVICCFFLFCFLFWFFFTSGCFFFLFGFLFLFFSLNFFRSIIFLKLSKFRSVSYS
jgi:hypothetical protein